MKVHPFFAGIALWAAAIPMSYGQSSTITITTPSTSASSTASLPNGTKSVPYFQTLTVSGGKAPLKCTKAAGDLPDGLGLDLATCSITGKPTTAGVYYFTVKVTDSATTPATATKDLAIVITEKPSITTSLLPDGVISATYSRSLAATGGTPSAAGAYTWTLAGSSSLPPGLTLSSGGSISGTPTAPGTYSFTVKATDSTTPVPLNAEPVVLSLTVAPALGIATASLPDGIAFADEGYPPKPYPSPQLLTATGGTPGAGYRWSVASGSALPPGLTLNEATGAVNGVPNTAGSYSVTFQVEDRGAPPQVATKALTIKVGAALSITTASLPNGFAPIAYTSQTLAAAGGTAYSWSLAPGSGPLPPGLTLDPTAGTISGTPTVPGSYPFKVLMTDNTTPSNPRPATRDMSITVLPTLSGYVSVCPSRPGACVMRGDAVVEATDPTTGATTLAAKTDSNGYYQLPLATGKYNVTAWAPYYQRQLIALTVGSAAQSQAFRLNPGHEGGEFYRMILGGQQAGASSTPSVRKLFADLHMDVPGFWRGPQDTYKVYGPMMRFWGDVRITSIPEAAPVQLSSVNLGSQVSKLDTSQIAQSVAFAFGAEFRIFARPPNFKDEAFATRNNNEYDLGGLTKFTESLVLGFGAITPLNPQQSATLVDVNLGDAQKLYQDVTGQALSACPASGTAPSNCVCPATTPSTSATAPSCISTLALLSKDRARFMRQWFAGLRLKTHYFTSAGIPISRPPATLDVSIGQNEEVTAGHLSGFVLRMEGFYPLPFQQLHMIYLFGRAYLKISGNPGLSNPYVLLPPPTPTPPATAPAIGSPGVLSLTLPVPSRDIYSLGIGVDLLQVVSKLAKPSQ